MVAVKNEGKKETRMNFHFHFTDWVYDCFEVLAFQCQGNGRAKKSEKKKKKIVTFDYVQEIDCFGGKSCAFYQRYCSPLPNVTTVT